MKTIMVMELQTLIAQNVRKMLNDKGLAQAYIAYNSEYGEGKVSKILNGEQKMTISDLSLFARVLSVREIDILTYPDVYVPVNAADPEPVEAVLQIKLKKDKKDQVLKLVFGDNNIEILNK